MCPCFNFKKAAVFLLTLAAGISVSFLLRVATLRNDDQRFSVVAERDPQSAVPNASGLHEQTGVDSLLTDKQKARLLFGPLLDDWLERKRISPAIESSPDLIEQIANTKLHRYEAAYMTDRAKRAYRATLVDLDSEVAPELAISFEFGDSGEGDLWLFRMEKGDFEVILHSKEKLDGFEPKRTRTNRFLDIQMFYRPREPDSLESKVMSDYEFDGEKYTLRKCSAIVNRYLEKDGSLRYLGKPRLEKYEDCC